MNTIFKYKDHFVIIFVLLLFTATARPQSAAPKVDWIRPANEKSPPVWGIHNGIVVGLWPASIEQAGQNAEGGPRGLLRIGYEYKGTVYLVNFIAVEPVVDGDMEFSEISPSRVDDKLGKQFWAAPSVDTGSFSPYASTRGVISHPDKLHPETEELSLYVFTEKFLDGAQPYFKLSIRSDKPGELGIQVFNREKSAVMERCAFTATMGNYSRLRLLYLKDTVVDARKLFAGYNDIEFDEKEPYSNERMLKNTKGDLMVVAESNETFDQLASWPQEPRYLSGWHWRYRPFYKLTQYWRVDSGAYDKSLKVRVNGRAKYWSGGSDDKGKYMDIPGGPAFENFELREIYQPGEKFYFGLSLKSAKALIAGF